MSEFEQATAAPGERRSRTSAPLTDTRALGSLWCIDTKAARVQIERPDGVVSVWVRNRVAAHVLDVPGRYRCGDETVVAG